MTLPPPIASATATGGVHESPRFPKAHSMGTLSATRAASVALLFTPMRVVTTTEPALTLTLTDEAGTPSRDDTLAMYAFVGKASMVV